jgi:ribosome-binding protein aMBF1 (putative translation factor)
MAERKPTTDAVEILHRLYFENDQEMMEMLETERIKGKIAQRVYNLCEEAGLTQKQLAKKVGTTAKMIDVLEMTDYEGHEIGDAILMFQWIAKAVGKRIDIDFQVVPFS